jgi:hypothetical protein
VCTVYNRNSTEHSTPAKRKTASRSDQNARTPYVLVVWSYCSPSQARQAGFKEHEEGTNAWWTTKVWVSLLEFIIIDAYCKLLTRQCSTCCSLVGGAIAMTVNSTAAVNHTACSNNMGREAIYLGARWLRHT